MQQSQTRERIKTPILVVPCWSQYILKLALDFGVPASSRGVTLTWACFCHFPSALFKKSARGYTFRKTKSSRPTRQTTKKPTAVRATQSSSTSVLSR